MQDPVRRQHQCYFQISLHGQQQFILIFSSPHSEWKRFLFFFAIVTLSSPRSRCMSLIWLFFHRPSRKRPPLSHSPCQKSTRTSSRGARRPTNSRSSCANRRLQLQLQRQLQVSHCWQQQQQHHHRSHHTPYAEMSTSSSTAAAQTRSTVVVSVVRLMS